MSRFKLPWRSLVVFLGFALVALLWAAATNHVWEDYYITFRASRNLATGEGLVFTPGERVHSFTSPLGVLLPALASVLTGNDSETAALFVFRVISAAAFASSGIFLWRTARVLYPALLPALLLVFLVSTDCKSVDFAMNGMETGILLFFLAWTLWALFTNPARQALHLGFAWAGLMWTRPDAWIYFGGLAAGGVFFRRRAAAGDSFGREIGMLARAGVIAGICYLPWVAWAWHYYGTPIPHTIVAKGLFSTSSWNGILGEVADFPARVWAGTSPLSGTFLPPYFSLGGWPSWMERSSGGLALVAASLWLLPFVRWEARVASWGAMLGQAYLYFVVKWAVPWYLPPVSVLSLVALVFALGQMFDSVDRRGQGAAGSRWCWLRRILLGFVGLGVAGSATMTVLAAHEMAVQQRLIEDGVRRPIGEWLKQNARSSHDSVFVESLGYIGYFSGLKMLDYPGLCAPEVVAARKRATVRTYPDCWPELIRDLRPDWLVMRRFEIAAVIAGDSELLKSEYEPVRLFSAEESIDAVGFLPGRGYLLYDAVFVVFRKRSTHETRP